MTAATPDPGHSDGLPGHLPAAQNTPFGAARAVVLAGLADADNQRTADTRSEAGCSLNNGE